MKFLVTLIALGVFAFGQTPHYGTDIFANPIYLAPSATDPAGACTNPATFGGIPWIQEPTLVQLSRASDSWWYCKGTTTSGTWTKVSNSTFPGGSGIPIVTGGSGWGSTLAAGTAGHVPRSNGSAYVDAQPAYADLSGTPTVPGPSITSPAMDGAATVGTGTTYARADHVHPTDATRAAATSNTTVNGIPCPLNGSCTIGTGGGGGGGGAILAVDTGTLASHWISSPTGCSSGDLVDGATFVLRPAHSSTGASDFNYCGVGTKAVILPGGSDLGNNDIFFSSTANPRSYDLVYHAAPIDKFELHPDMRIGNDTEILTVGTDPKLAVNTLQVHSLITTYAPMGTNLGNRFQLPRMNGTALVPTDSPQSPGSGRIYSEASAQAGAALVTNSRMPSLTNASNCGSFTFNAITASTPRMVNHPTADTTVGHSCVLRSSVAVTWSGSEEIFDATVDLSQAANVSYLFGLVDHAASGFVGYTSGNYAGALAAFRFNPGAGDTVTWKCVMAKDGSSTPLVGDAGATFGTLGANVITQLQFRLDEGSGTAHWFIGQGGVLNEVCTTPTWSNSMPGSVALDTLLGEQITGTVGAAPIMSIAYFGLEADTVPGVRP